MGVIKRIENLFEIKCSISEETLYIPSGDDDDDDNDGNNDSENEQIIHAQPENRRVLQNNSQISRRHPPTIGPSFLNLKTHSGRKKYRRYHMVNQLLTLKEEDESQEVTIEDFIDTSKSGFSLLLENDESLKVWNEFISSSEERQKQVLEGDTTKKTVCPSRPVINRALRSLLRKKNLPLGMVDYLEQELISFFAAAPTKIYISPELNSFERLLLHSISNYHRLASLSFESGPEKVKLVRVKNPKKEFWLPSLPLIQYLKSNYELR